SLGRSGSPINKKSRRCRLRHVISCVQSQLITCPDDLCSPSSATCQCPSVPAVSAHPCHLPVPISVTSMLHISAYQCTSMPNTTAHLSCLSVSPISASQCRPSVPVSVAYQCHLTVHIS
ncbi:unnamed protein product, partial [Staurois parvus]